MTEPQGHELKEDSKLAADDAATRSWEKTGGAQAAAAADDTASQPAVSERAADETLRLVEDHGDEFPRLTPDEERKLHRKVAFHVLTLVLVINLMLFIDKATLSYAWFLGIYQETGISDAQFDDLNTIFYTGYIIAQAPGHYLIQRLPLGKFVAATVFLWSVVVFLHCTAQNYGGLIALRFFLGFFESVLVPAMEMTMNMFFTPAELVRLQPIFWISCVGAPVPAGFIAYGLLYSQSSILPWKFFMIITGGVTLLIAVYSWFWYPNNPAQARFLSLEEKVHTIRRVHDATRSSIEQKTFKPHQLHEALRDPVTWLFFWAAFLLMISNNVVYQQSILLEQIGEDDFTSTLVSAVGGIFASVCGLLGWLGLKYVPNRSALWGTFWCLPAIAGGIGMVALNWNQKISLLACLLLAGNTFGNTYIIALGWASATAGGYTKKLVRNVMWMAGYGIANIISPQIWRANDAPRYYGAWIAQIVVSWVGTPLCMLAIHWILARRNTERRAWIAEQEALGKRPVGVVEQRGDDGGLVKVEVDVSLLDLTDFENRYFLYQL